MRKLLLISISLLIAGCTITDYKKYRDLPTYTQEVEEVYLNLSYKRGYKTQARPINFNETKNYMIQGHQTWKSQSEINKVVLGWCENTFEIKCLIAYEGNKFVWQENLINYKEEQVQLEIEAKQKAEEQKQALIAEYIERCIGFGFEGKTEIATCFQQEVFNERQLAQERLVQQQRLAQQPQLVQEEEVSPFLEWLGELTEEVIEDYFDQQEHDRMHQNDRKDIFRNCRPNCFNPPKP